MQGEAAAPPPVSRAPLVRASTLPPEAEQDAVDACAGALEAAGGDPERAAAAAKAALEKRGGAWNVVVGGSFSYAVTHGSQGMILLFVGATGVLAWRV
jgi:hypothetical protein